MAGIEILNRDMFSEAEATRLLTVPQSTLHYWLEGGERRGKSYRPILRGDPGGTGHRRARPLSPITSTAVKDDDWIPEVSRRGRMIETRDSRIQDHRSEIAAVRESGARMVAPSTA